MIVRGKLLDGHGKLVGSGLRIEDGRVAEIFDVEPDVTSWITPVSLIFHCHGGGGSSFRIIRARKVSARPWTPTVLWVLLR